MKTLTYYAVRPYLLSHINQNSEVLFVTFIMNLRSRTQGDIACAFHSTSQSQSQPFAWNQTCKVGLGSRKQMLLRVKVSWGVQSFKSRCISQEGSVYSSMGVLKPTVSYSSHVKMDTPVQNLVGLWSPHLEVQLNRTHSTDMSQLTCHYRIKELQDPGAPEPLVEMRKHNFELSERQDLWCYWYTGMGCWLSKWKWSLGEQILLLVPVSSEVYSGRSRGEGWAWKFILWSLPRKHEVRIIRGALGRELGSGLQDPVHKQLLLPGLL